MVRSKVLGKRRKSRTSDSQLANPRKHTRLDYAEEEDEDEMSDVSNSVAQNANANMRVCADFFKLLNSDEDSDGAETSAGVFTPDRALMHEILDEYDKVAVEYNCRVETDGYDYFCFDDQVPRTTISRRKLKKRVVKSQNHNIYIDTAGCKFNIPICYLQSLPTTPPMRYWTHTNVNVIGKDEHALSHVPYLGDDDDDTGFGEELLHTYEEGIHGVKTGCGKIINDYILYHVVARILNKHHWGSDPDTLLKVMTSLYHLFPNKTSARDMASSFQDLENRFNPATGELKTRIFNDMGEIKTNCPTHVLQSSNISLACKRCFFMDCIFHQADITMNDVHMQKDKGSMAEPCTPCNSSCYRNFLKSSPRKKSPRKASNMELKVDAMFSPSEPVEWTPHEQSMVALLLNAGVSCSCRIAALLSLLCRSSPKTCKLVYDYISTTRIVPPAEDSEVRRLFEAESKTKVHRNFRTANGGQLANDKPYKSCKHDGPCSAESGCTCIESRLMCTKYCGCPPNCASRFPGCRCKPGNCRTNQCQCYFASWGCDPHLCHECNCNVSEDSNLPICRNVSIQRSLQRRLYIAPSEVAGYGCFAEEPIIKGDFIGEYVGEIISQNEAERRGKIYDKFKCSYLFSLNVNQVVDATRVGNIMRFVNHSKQPNCVGRVMVVNGDHHIGLFALKDIAANEELFFDYSYNRSQISEFVYKERHHRYLRNEKAPSSNGGSVRNGRLRNGGSASNSSKATTPDSDAS